MFGLNEADLKAVLAKAAELDDISLLNELEFRVEISLVAGSESTRWMKVQADPLTVGKLLTALGPTVSSFPDKMKELWDMAHQQ